MRARAGLRIGDRHADDLDVARRRKMSEMGQRGGAPIGFWFDFASGYAY
jgi:hypothetical protein